MSRPRYPSDDARLKAAPHIRVALEVSNHPRTAEAWADPALRGMLVQLWLIAGQKYAGRRGDEVVLSRADCAAIAGRTQHVYNLRAVRALCVRVSYPVREHGVLIAVKVENFSKHQGYNSAARGGAPHENSASEDRRPKTEDRGSGVAEPGAESAAASPPAGGAPALEGRIGRNPLRTMRSGATHPAPADPLEGFEAEKLVNVLGAKHRSAALVWLVEELPRLIANARRELAVEGIVDPTREQVRAMLIDRLHAWWAQHRKRPHALQGNAPPAAGSKAERRGRAARLYGEGYLEDDSIECLDAYEAEGSPAVRWRWRSPEDRAELERARARSLRPGGATAARRAHAAA